MTVESIELFIDLPHHVTMTSKVTRGDPLHTSSCTSHNAPATFRNQVRSLCICGWKLGKGNQHELSGKGKLVLINSPCAPSSGSGYPSQYNLTFT
jgi:hypothetical protein